ncbi:MAG TPA: twin-arginine translocase TatA/TatE family subunit [Bacteroidia bacterium]|nr:twin-arginine translocase TatA/TatE family subunit [Bacteroidia bacterium]
MTPLIILGFLGGLGGGEIFLILLVVLLIFGGKKIPELARGLGKGIREFKDASSGLDKEDEKKEIKKPE